VILTSSSTIDSQELNRPYRKGSAWLGVLSWLDVVVKAEARATDIARQNNAPIGSEVWHGCYDMALEAVADRWEEILLQGKEKMFAIAE
jgi:hypothetical protein